MTHSRIPAGNLDVHAHLLPEACFTVPTAAGPCLIYHQGDDLIIGTAPMNVDADKLVRVERLVEDMDSCDIAVRVVSAPPYAFPSTSDQASVDYAGLFNDELLRACERFPERLRVLGVLPVCHEAATRQEARRLSEMGFVGVSVPPIIGDAGIGDPAVRYVLESADQYGLAVLVHPTQRLQPGYGGHYLRNLIGNPVESTVGIGSYVLGTAPRQLPDLRILFLHGAGCAPGLLGRWDHGWAVRNDVSADTDVRPSEVFRNSLYADLLTHSDPAAELLRQTIDPSRLVLGSDYPFDMADLDPVASARRRSFALDQLAVNGWRWLGAHVDGR